eukprot:Polyplicarium_translucidae@DN1395_c0_g1_i1.p2
MQASSENTTKQKKRRVSPAPSGLTGRRVRIEENACQNPTPTRRQVQGSTALGNDESIFLFTNGLKPELAREIRLREPESLREAQKLARRLETIQQALQGSEPMDLSVARSRPDRGQNESSEDASMLELWRTRTHRKVL